jgi:uncharacterized protein
MTIDHRLIHLLVCPVCKGPLEMQRDANEQPAALACPADRLAFPIRDGLPIMLESEARNLDAAPDSVSASPTPPAAPSAP